jgi:Family of unknown function (DUF6526)
MSAAVEHFWSFGVTGRNGARESNMAQEKVQNFENHVRFVPMFHFFIFPVLVINLISSLVQLRNGIGFASVLSVLVAAALAVLALIARIFALTVQDRVIRLEMRMRMASLLPGDLQPRIGEFTVAQLVSLRFAGDEELPALARQVLEEKIEDRKAIKRRIKNWQGDFLRA